ncbi:MULTISPECIES: hypothetical protein [Sorangium]|uniref:Uncharacterized protein n=1 Tax=Sorangium cellulosum TaxID=56 RepID=A0A4P2QGM9_SORCE|nr:MULTISPECIES: hypothetical protein [Sorangium]AUX28668.1 uncharacterized protein SOCE836_007490 [Sorangium cellulosum]WCQ88065.1 hypothetical protein NQZ70_00736 [Sorangium sp. Soce836]
MKGTVRADGSPVDLSPTPTPPPVTVVQGSLDRGLPLDPPPLGAASDPLEQGLLFDPPPLGAAPGPVEPGFAPGLIDPALQGAPLHLAGVGPYGSFSAPSPRERRARAWRALGAFALAAATVIAVVVLTARGIAARMPVNGEAFRAMTPVSRALLLASRSVAEGAAARVLVAPEVFARWQGATPPPEIRHDGYASIRGGVLFTPETFRPAGSSYDLVIHFHGNTQLVRESAEVAGLNAAVAVINLGIGSGAYEELYAQPGVYESLLADIDRALAQRGLPTPKLRRLALSSWSAGYGAIAKILELRRGIDALDAILVTDGIHCGFVPDHPSGLNTLQLASFARAAQLAAAGQVLFTITHSEIDPIAYASSSATANYLLGAAAGHPVERSRSLEAPPHLRLRAAEGAVSRKLEKQMIPTTEAAVGELHVRGFRGNTPEHHMAHLLQMASTVLPELVERWREGGDPAPPSR